MKKSVLIACLIFYSSVMTAVSSQQAAAQITASSASNAVPSEPLTLSQMNLLLRRRVGRDMTEGDLAVIIDRYGIAFDPKPDVISRLRAAGAHQHLINAIKRANDKLIAAAGEVVSIRPAAPDPVLEEARTKVMEYAEDLPDFVCNQEITRYADLDGSGAWERYDQLTYELTYRQKTGESYKPVNIIGRPVTRALEESGGAYSTGDWATALLALFRAEAKTVFKAAGTDRLGNRQTLVYDFRVPKAHSSMTIRFDNLPPIVSGYSGSLWIDTETKRVLRIEQAADDLPTGYPVTQSEGSTDYDLVKLRGLDIEFLLPVRSEFTIGDRRQKRFSRNIIYFKFYRKFETDIKISDPGEEEKPPAKPDKPSGKEQEERERTTGLNNVSLMSK